MRRTYRLSERQVERLLDAGQLRTPYGSLLLPDAESRVDQAWKEIGRELTFEWWTVEDVPGEPMLVTAEEQDMALGQ